MSDLLEIEDLTVVYQQAGRRLEAARHIHLNIPAGQTCGLVGESGSGKTTLGLTVMRYLPPAAEVTAGAVRFAGRNLLALSQAELRQVWGSQIALVPQNPLSAFNPTLRLGEQAAETLRQGRGLGPGEARARVLKLFEAVQLADPARVAGSYPHQVSVGMLQRVLIAMALGAEPRLLVMDEPTSGLDVTTQMAALELLRELIRQRGTAVLYITHNLGVTAQVADRVVVMYAGELSEDAPAADLFRQPLHPYTQGLLDSVPRLGQNKAEVQLRPIQGRIPPLDDLPEGCIFRPRCPLAIEVCLRYPPFYAAGPQRRARCHRWDEIARGEVSAHQPVHATPPERFTAAERGRVLALRDVAVHFSSSRRSLLDVLRGRHPPPVRAVDGVHLDVPRGQTVGLVGESGSGKTTLARAVVGLAERTGGTIELLDSPLPPGLGGRSQERQRLIQIVFQDPEEALNPFLTVGETLREPVQRLLGQSRQEAQATVERLLGAVHLPPSYAGRLPGQLSGGEKQRVAIARAFAPRPELLIADEPVSSLDVSVQASILALFTELQVERGISTLFISHDLAVVGYLADRVAVIYRGHLMEVNSARAIFDPPYHPYTETLLAAVPLIDPQGCQVPMSTMSGTSGMPGTFGRGETPGAQVELSGCPFHLRCPRFLGRVCVEQVPPWREDAQTGARVFCHIPLDELRAHQERPFAFSRREEPFAETGD